MDHYLLNHDGNRTRPTRHRPFPFESDESPANRIKGGGGSVELPPDLYDQQRLA